MQEGVRVATRLAGHGRGPLRQLLEVQDVQEEQPPFAHILVLVLVSSVPFADRAPPTVPFPPPRKGQKQGPRLQGIPLP